MTTAPRLRAQRLAVLGAPLSGFVLTLALVEARWSPLVRLDDSARDQLNAVAVSSSDFVSTMNVLGALGSTTGWAVTITLAAAWLLRQRRTRETGFLVLTVAGSALLNAAVKLAVDRARPVFSHPVAHADGYSFPSGHAQAAVAGTAALLVVFLPGLQAGSRRVAMSAGVVVVLAIGFSRVALGVHYVSDVLGGYLLGTAWVMVMAEAFRLQYRTHPPG